MAETPTYNHFDIKRYLQHKMSPQEMHAFEKALMDDPFLADAMEGFSAGDETLAEVHLAGIEQQLTGRKERTKVVPLPVRKTTWRKAAAIVLVIVTGGVLSYSLLSKNESNKSIAGQMTADSTKEIIIQRNTINPTEKPLAKLEESPKKDLTHLRQNSSSVYRPYASAKPAPAINSIVQADTIENALAGKTAGLSLTDSKTAPVMQDETIRLNKRMKVPSGQPLNEFKGKVTDVEGEPVASAIIIDNTSHTKNAGDTNGNFILKAPDSITRVTVNYPGYSAATATINSKAKLNNIVPEKSSQSLSEVVVMGYGTKKKRMVADNYSANAEPIGGWKNFEQYLKRKIDSLKANDNENLYNREQVVLAFSVDKKGNPSNIKVREKANKAVADKAIEIISEGPKWKNKIKDKNVTIAITF